MQAECCFRVNLYSGNGIGCRVGFLCHIQPMDLVCRISPECFNFIGFIVHADLWVFVSMYVADAITRTNKEFKMEKKLPLVS